MGRFASASSLSQQYYAHFSKIFASTVVFSRKREGKVCRGKVELFYSVLSGPAHPVR